LVIMKRYEVRDCLLCNGALGEQVTWRTILTNEYPRTICVECVDKFESIESQPNQPLFSLYKYNEQMKDFLHRYKFMHDVILAKVFRQTIHQSLSKKKEIIVPIPMHPQKLKERTFPHVDTLLKEANIPYKHFLEKITTDSQSSKSRQQRLHAPQIFALKENEDPRNKELILVDDITTTGMTIQHAKRILLEAGAKSVTAFTLIKG